jgi:hypothetical protein
MSGFDAMQNLRMHWTAHGVQSSPPRLRAGPVMLAVSHQPLTPRSLFLPTICLVITM